MICVYLCIFASSSSFKMEAIINQHLHPPALHTPQYLNTHFIIHPSNHHSFIINLKACYSSHQRFINPFMHFFMHLCIHASVHSSIHASVHLYIRLSIRQTICKSIHASFIHASPYRQRSEPFCREL